MELIKNTYRRNIYALVALICLLSSCSSDDSQEDGTVYTYYYPTEVQTINTGSLGRPFDPRGIAISNNKLYVCNDSILEIFDASTLRPLESVKAYSKGNTHIKFAGLTSISIDGGRLYIGSQESRLFVLDQNTNQGITYVGNGQWWQTFVHVFGVVVKDGLVVVKEKENSVKIFETSQITAESPWNLNPIAKLNTQTGYTQYYSMGISDGQIVVAGRDSKSYLHYDINTVLSNKAASLTTPLTALQMPFPQAKPTAILFDETFVYTAENIDNLNYLKIYPKDVFLRNQYQPLLNVSDVQGKGTFGSISSIAHQGQQLYLSDNTNKNIRVIKINTAQITEYN